MSWGAIACEKKANAKRFDREAQPSLMAFYFYGGLQG